MPEWMLGSVLSPRWHWRPRATSARPPSTTPENPEPKEIPEIIVDINTEKRYERGTFLGKGGYAKCYELKNLATGEITAVKIIPKSELTSSSQQKKLSQEIR